MNLEPCTDDVRVRGKQLVLEDEEGASSRSVTLFPSTYTRTTGLFMAALFIASSKGPRQTATKFRNPLPSQLPLYLLLKLHSIP